MTNPDLSWGISYEKCSNYCSGDAYHGVGLCEYSNSRSEGQ